MLSVVFLKTLMRSLAMENNFALDWYDESLSEPITFSEISIVSLPEEGSQILYIVGGERFGTPSPDVKYAILESDGSIGDFNNTKQLTFPTYFHSVESSKGRLFVVGGQISPSELTDWIYCSSIDSLGQISSWTTGTLGRELGAHDTVIVNDRMYVIGGFELPGGFTNAVESAYIGNGSECRNFYDWRPEESITDVENLSNHSATKVTLENGRTFIYVAGGYISNSVNPYLNNKVYRNEVQIQNEGLLGRWFDLGNVSDMEGMQHLSILAAGNYLYVIGGSPTEYPAATPSVSSDMIYRAQIFENGDLGLWESTRLPISIHGHDSAASHLDQIYIVGGKSYTIEQNAVYYTPLAFFSKHVTPTNEVFVGEQLFYTLYYTNNGLRPLTNVIITDEIPANSYLVDPDYPLGTRVLTWTIPVLDMNESGVATFAVRVMPPLTAVPPELSTPTPTPTAPQPDSDLHCSTSSSGGGGTPRPSCTPTSTPIPLPTTPVLPTIPPPGSTRYFDLTPIPVINQAWLCEEEWCIQSNMVINTPYHTYLPIILR